MIKKTFGTFALCLTVLCFSGCKEVRDEKKAYPITGKILVDGKPVEGLQIQLHDKSGVDTSKPTFPTASTDAAGNLKVSTYAEGDGAPEGEYTLTVEWKDFNVVSRSYSGPDKLNKKYSDPKKSSVQLSVGPGKSNDLGTAELTTKK